MLSKHLFTTCRRMLGLAGLLALTTLAVQAQQDSCIQNIAKIGDTVPFQMTSVRADNGAVTYTSGLLSTYLQQGIDPAFYSTGDAQLYSNHYQPCSGFLCTQPFWTGAANTIGLQIVDLPGADIRINVLQGPAYWVSEAYTGQCVGPNNNVLLGIPFFPQGSQDVVTISFGTPTAPPR